MGIEQGLDQSAELVGENTITFVAAPLRKTQLLQTFRNALAAFAIAPLQSLLRHLIQEGTLLVVAPNGRSYAYGDSDPTVTIRLTNWTVVSRIVLNPDLAIGEAYMDGTLIVERGDLCALLDLLILNLNRQRLHWLRRVRRLARRRWRFVAQHNPVSRARANVAHHYDLSDSLYKLCLDSDRQYSCGYYRSPADTLERAQEQKKCHIAAKLLLQSGQRVLDIGSGWGGLARHLAQTADVDVTGVTLSTEQHAYAERVTQESHLADRVRFFLKDYRHETGKYDRIVSVGMFEHVGVGHYKEYFEKVRDLLTEDGVAVVHTIGVTDGPGASHPWIAKYIFPGGYTPALSEVMPAIENAGLHITDIEILRLHYAETLKAWRLRFASERDNASKIYDERFCRMWEFYLTGCEAAFRRNNLVVFQIQLSKGSDLVPLTRDYIVNDETRADKSIH
jgi:cyclopropane-fatty-acyl-phospholipid synthase